MSEKIYTEEMRDSVNIPPEIVSKLKGEEDSYTIVISCSTSHSPKELGIGEDARELALMFTYIGRAK